MGIHLIREATDRLEHEPRPGGGNILTLDRRLDPRPGAFMSMQTTIEQVEGAVPITILALDGELDASNYQEVIDTVRRLYDEGTRG